MKRIVLKTHHSPEMLTRLCRSHRVYKTCVCGVLDCPFGNDVNCAEVMPWMWKEIMEEESDAEKDIDR